MVEFFRWVETLRDSFIADKLIDIMVDMKEDLPEQDQSQIDFPDLHLALHYIALPSSVPIEEHFLLHGLLPQTQPTTHCSPASHQWSSRTTSWPCRKRVLQIRHAFQQLTWTRQPRTRCSSILSFDWLPLVRMWSWVTTERVCTENASKEFFLNTAASEPLEEQKGRKKLIDFIFVYRIN